MYWTAADSEHAHLLSRANKPRQRRRKSQEEKAIEKAKARFRRSI